MRFAGRPFVDYFEHGPPLQSVAAFPRILSGAMTSKGGRPVAARVCAQISNRSCERGDNGYRAAGPCSPNNTASATRSGRSGSRGSWVSIARICRAPATMSIAGAVGRQAAARPVRPRDERRCRRTRTGMPNTGPGWPLRRDFTRTKIFKLRTEPPMCSTTGPCCWVTTSALTLPGSWDDRRKCRFGCDDSTSHQRPGRHSPPRSRRPSAATENRHPHG
jgi:hypothetical protein